MRMMVRKCGECSAELIIPFTDPHFDALKRVASAARWAHNYYVPSDVSRVNIDATEWAELLEALQALDAIETKEALDANP